MRFSSKQIEKIQKIKSDTTPIVLKSAKEIKALEIALTQRMLKLSTNRDEYITKAKNEYAIIDKIALKKATLTKYHLLCIQRVLYSCIGSVQNSVSA